MEGFFLGSHTENHITGDINNEYYCEEAEIIMNKG